MRSYNQFLAAVEPAFKKIQQDCILQVRRTGTVLQNGLELPIGKDTCSITFINGISMRNILYTSLNILGPTLRKKFLSITKYISLLVDMLVV